MDRNNRITLADVAKHAGVSLATASRALNGTARVRDDVRKRVEEAAAILAYLPLNLRQNEREAFSQSLVLLIPDILNPFFNEVISGIQEEAEIDGLNLVLTNTYEDPRREQQALDRLSNISPEGVVVFSRIPSEKLIAFHEECQIPMAVMNRRIEHVGIASIMVDLELATYRSAKHLLNLNHTKIAYLGGPEWSFSSQARLKGLMRALREAQLTIKPEWTTVGFPSIEGGFQTMSKILSTHGEKPSAIITYNDLMALGAVQAARAFGLSVPKDVSVIGFDDITIAAHSNPPLTTVAQPKQRMGRLAVQMLRRMRRGEDTISDGFVLLESPLIIRDSTAQFIQRNDR